MNIFFSGIGGVGIGPLAQIASDAGYNIFGTDQTASLITEELTRKGIEVSYDQSGDYLRQVNQTHPIDWYVHTAALPPNHPELLTAKELNIKTAKRDELLAEIIARKNLKLIAVAGTHGKTTTTGMLIWAMQKLNIPVSYSIGTTIHFGSSGHYSDNSQFFIYECDEFDRNFLHFNPYRSLITSVDYDHPDTYPTELDYKQAFNQFFEQSEKIFVWQNDLDYLNYQESNLELAQDATGLKLAGAHNRRNASLVFDLLNELFPDTDQDTILNAINSFPGTDRRFEKLADNLYTDYGHHPVEIQATLQMANELSRNVVLIYQPHQNIRQHEIKDQYLDQFEGAKKIYWLPTYLSREDANLEILSPEFLYRNLTNKQNVESAEMNDMLWQKIQNHLDNGDLVLGMGAGTIDGWLRQCLNKTSS